MQRVTITSMRYHMRYHTRSHCSFSLSLAWFGAICIELLRVTVKFIKNIYYIIFKKLTVTRCKKPKPGKSQRKCTVTHVVTRSSYGNAMHYGLSMFREFEKLPYCLVEWNMLPHITKL